MKVCNDEERRESYLRTESFFVKEDNSTSLEWGETLRSFTAFVFKGSWISSISLFNKLIWKIPKKSDLYTINPNDYVSPRTPCLSHRQSDTVGIKDVLEFSRQIKYLQQIDCFRQGKYFTLVSTCSPPIPESLLAISKFWLEESMSKRRAPSTWMSFC